MAGRKISDAIIRESNDVARPFRGRAAAFNFALIDRKSVV